MTVRQDIRTNLLELLAPLEARAVPGGYHLGDTAALYPPQIAALEGWARCLWGIAPFIAGGGTWPNTGKLRETLVRGTDPADSAWWGECGDKDQRLVEMAPIAFALILAPAELWDPLDAAAKENVYRWLSAIEQRALPDTNWVFFRLIVCAAFRKLGLPVNLRAEQEAFDTAEACYRGDGWYEDGVQNGYYDCYNPMGFHFYGLFLAALAAERGEHGGCYAQYIERAKLFGRRFAAWFHHDGSVIPFGRSLAYRFAGVSFFSACAYAGLEVIPWAEMKGIVMRHLRYWFSRPILDSGGLLSIGYDYPNLIMADSYNSPGSPYWALKTYLILALPEDHPFWRAAEAPLPAGPLCRAEAVPGFVVGRTGEDAQLLNAGRFLWDSNHAAQKYGKFAYSARFGFCVSHGNYGLNTCSCDSMLLLSEGDNYWRERRETYAVETGANWVRSRWRPWPDVEVTTTLTWLDSGWHIRVHRIESRRALTAVEGGFSIPRFGGRDAFPETRREGIGGCLLRLADTASRIEALEADSSRTGTVVYPAPNLNLRHPSVAVPALAGTLPPGTTVWACAVRAGDSETVCAEAVPGLAGQDAEGL
jgi:hypothetical protein